MDKQALKKISKRLSYVLRHRPDSVGLELEEGGWLRVDDLLAALANNGKSVSQPVLVQVVAENDKQRFEFSEDGLRIRARQGHSAEVDLGYEPATPPDVLFHGTATRNLDPIFEQRRPRGYEARSRKSWNLFVYSTLRSLVMVYEAGKRRR